MKQGPEWNLQPGRALGWQMAPNTQQTLNQGHMSLFFLKLTAFLHFLTESR